MREITTIGLDLAKSVFQVHGINEAGGEVTRKRLRRGQMLTFFAGHKRTEAFARGDLVRECEVFVTSAQFCLNL